MTNHEDFERLAAEMHTPVGNAVAPVGRALRQDRVGADLAAPLRNDEVAWLDADEDLAIRGATAWEDRPMTDPGETVVSRWLAAGDGGDFETFDDLLHTDAVIHAPGGLSTTSLEAEKAVWREALAAMPDLRHHVQEVVVDGATEMARVVVTGTMTARFGGVDGNGRSFQIDQAVITHLRHGKVAEAWEIADLGALRKQVT